MEKIMDKKQYMPRIIDDTVDRYLATFGAVCIEGPKWCGKTTTAEQYAKSVLKLQDIDRQEEYQMWLDIKPSKLLEGEKLDLLMNGRWHQYCGMVLEIVLMNFKGKDYIY